MSWQPGIQRYGSNFRGGSVMDPTAHSARCSSRWEKGPPSLRRPWSSQQQQRSRYAAAVKSYAAGEWPRASMHTKSTRSATQTQNNSPTLQRGARHRRWHDVAATTAAVLLLLCCCCCCAATAAAPRSAMHRGARSAMLIRDASQSIASGTTDCFSFFASFFGF